MTERPDFRPTRKAEWVRVGDRCQSPVGWLGTVRRILDQSIPVARVDWDNGTSTRILITHLRRV